MPFAHPPRIIYNDDNCSLNVIPGEPSVDKLVHAVDYLQDSQVDCVCWFVAAGVAHCYRSEVIDTLWDLADKREFGIGEPDKLPLHLHRQGIDSLPLVIDLFRERNIRFYASFRMNDAHHKASPSGVLAPRFWQEHQEWRLWEITDGYTWYNACMDYAHAEVRQRYLDAIEEFLGMYDVDGLELDFGRNPYLFQPSEGWDRRNILTGMLSDVRTLVAAAGKRRGQEMGLIVRVPFGEQLRRNAGMDIERWCEENLLDVLVMTNFVNNLNQSVEPWLSLCREQGVLFYGCNEAGPAILDSRYERIRVANPLAAANNHVVLQETPEEVAMRQRAMAQNFLAQGTDGVYMFNYPCKLFEGECARWNNPEGFTVKCRALHEIGAQETLGGTAKQYTFWEDLPIHVEAARPPQYYQTARFTVRDPDLAAAGTRVRLSFHQVALRSQHAPRSSPDPDPVLPPGDMRYLLNGELLDDSTFTRATVPEGKIASGFTLPRHERISVEVAGTCLNAGENSLAFHIPRFPGDTDPYVHIFELLVTVVPQNTQ